MRWAYGITTVPTRMSNGLLERTLKSLIAAGFPRPRLFIDGLPLAAIPESITELDVTCRSSPIRIYGNWHLGMSELFIRDSQADRYAMFQDDFVTYRNLRDYLECCLYPAKGYLNLYTFPENERKEHGWYQSNQLGKGAVAIVLNNDAVRALLTNTFWITRPAIEHKNPNRAWKFVDGGIVEAFRQQGYREYVHNPSLVQHTGTRSTLGNGRHQQATTFKGEDFDALELIKQVKIPALPEPKKSSRIGLASYPSPIPIKIASQANIYRWLVKPDPERGVSAIPDDLEFMSCPVGRKVEQFVREVDIVVFFKKPPFANLLKCCEMYGKKVVVLTEEREDWTGLEKELV